MIIGSIDNLKKYKAVDLTDCETRQDKIIKIFKNLKYTHEKDNFFKYLTSDEKTKYLFYTSYENIASYITKNHKTIFENIKEIIKVNPSVNEYDLKRVMEEIKSEDIKYEYLWSVYSIMNHFHLEQTAAIFKDNKYIIKFYLNKIRYSKCSVDYVKRVLNDTAKSYFLKDFNDEEKATIILYIQDKNILKKYVDAPYLYKYRSTIVARTEDTNLILDKFIQIDSLTFKLNLINKVKDNDLKKMLICMLDDKNLMEFLISNETTLSNNDFVKKLCETTIINPNITIGVELEACNENIKNFNKTKTVFSDFNIKQDLSVKSGFEIVSPILHYNLTDMNKLYQVCELLKRCNFYTDQSCGGHIHIGASYFTSKEDYYMLVYLYSNVENILYYITDKEGTIKRSSVERFAMKSKEEYLKAIDEGLFNKEHFNSEITDVFNEINKDRYKGLNFKNIGSEYKNTIEFRMPNGEIEFSELLVNIKLFARLIEMSHELVQIDKTNEIKEKALKLSHTKDEEEKLLLLLEILFPNPTDRIIYLKRYKTNYALTLKANEELASSLRDKLFYEVVDYDEENHSLVKKII